MLFNFAHGYPHTVCFSQCSWVSSQSLRFKAFMGILTHLCRFKMPMSILTQLWFRTSARVSICSSLFKTLMGILTRIPFHNAHGYPHTVVSFQNAHGYPHTVCFSQRSWVSSRSFVFSKCLWVLSHCVVHPSHAFRLSQWLGPAAVNGRERP